MKAFVIKTIFIMKFLLLLLITVAIVADGAEKFKCYKGKWANSTEEATSIDQAEQEDCDKGKICVKRKDGE